MNPKRFYSVLATVLLSGILLNPRVYAQYTSDYQSNIISGVTINWVGSYVVGGSPPIYTIGSDFLGIYNGGVLSSDSGYIAYTSTPGDNSVLVSGSGSVWNNATDLYIGAYGTRGNSLTISDGGAVYDGLGWIDGSGGSVLVTGTGSVWSNRNSLYMGSFGNGGNSLTIANGGAVYSVSCGIGEAPEAVLITGSGSVWNNTGALSMGSADCSLTISNGGAAYSGSASMPMEDSALVTGTGSVWNVGGSLDMGYMGNSLTVADGGVVCAGSMSSSYMITVSGGGLYVTNGLGTGVLQVNRGTLTLNSGTVTADQLVVTNPASVVFNGGVLSAKATTVNNGLVFTVGNGTSTAMFTLDSGGSGFHSFANGLTISSNATLRGNGTVVGVVAVNGGGVLAPGASPGGITFSNNLTLAPSSTFAVELNGTGAGQYDQIIGLGTVSVSNSVLSLSLGYTPSVGDSFTIISNQGPSTVFGVFVDPQGDVLTNNATFLAGGTTFEINYDGNPDGQDVTLTAMVPEPASWLLLAMGMGAVLGMRRLGHRRKV